MDVIQTRRGWRRPLILGLTALAVTGVGACGDSDDDPAPSGTAGTTPTETSRDGAKAPKTDREPPAEGAKPQDDGGEEEVVADTVRDMYRALASSDASGVCAAMTAAAREQIAQQPPGGGTPAPGEGI